MAQPGPATAASPAAPFASSESVDWATKFTSEINPALRYSTDPTSNYVHIYCGGDYRYAYYLTHDIFDNVCHIFYYMSYALTCRLLKKVEDLRPQFDATLVELMSLPSQPQHEGIVDIDNSRHDDDCAISADSEHHDAFNLSLLRSALALDDVDLVRRLCAAACHCGHTYRLMPIFHMYIRSKVASYAADHPDELPTHRAHPILAAVHEDDVTMFMTAGGLPTLITHNSLLPLYGMTELHFIRRARAYLLLRGAYRIVLSFGLSIFAPHEAYTKALLCCAHMPLVELFVQAEIAARTATTDPSTNSAADGTASIATDRVVLPIDIEVYLDSSHRKELDIRLLRPLTTQPSRCALHYLMTGFDTDFARAAKLFKIGNWGKSLTHWWGTTSDPATSCPGLIHSDVLTVMLRERCFALDQANYVMGLFDFKLLQHRAYAENLLRWVRTVKWKHNINDVVVRYLQYSAQRALCADSYKGDIAVTTQYIIPRVPFFCHFIGFNQPTATGVFPAAEHVRLLVKCNDREDTAITVVDGVTVALDYLFLLPRRPYTITTTPGMVLLDLDLGIIVPSGYEVGHDGAYLSFIADFE